MKRIVIALAIAAALSSIARAAEPVTWIEVRNGTYTLHVNADLRVGKSSGTPVGIMFRSSGTVEGKDARFDRVYAGGQEVVPGQGGTSTGWGVQPATVTVSMPQGFTASSGSVSGTFAAGKLKGDGTEITGLPGGGDMVTLVWEPIITANTNDVAAVRASTFSQTSIQLQPSQIQPGLLPLSVTAQYALSAATALNATSAGTATNAVNYLGSIAVSQISAGTLPSGVTAQYAMVAASATTATTAATATAYNGKIAVTQISSGTLPSGVTAQYAATAGSAQNISGIIPVTQIGNGDLPSNVIATSIKPGLYMIKSASATYADTAGAVGIVAGHYPGVSVSSADYATSAVSAGTAANLSGSINPATQISAGALPTNVPASAIQPGTYDMRVGTAARADMATNAAALNGLSSATFFSTAAAQTGFASVGVSTAGLRSDMSIAQSQITAVSASTTALRSDMTAAQARLTAVAISTAAMQSTLAAVGLSTGNIDAAMFNKNTGGTVTGPIVAGHIESTSTIKAPSIQTAELDMTGAGAGGWKFRDASHTYFVFIRASDTLTHNTTFYLPTGDGSGGQAILTDGAGHLYFGSVASGWTGTAASNLEMGIFAINSSSNINCVAGNFQTVTATTTNTKEVNVIGSGVGGVKLYDSGGTNYLLMRASGTYVAISTWTLPGGAPSAGTVLTNDGANNLYWSALASTPVYANTASTATYAANADTLDGQHGAYYSIREEVSSSTGTLRSDITANQNAIAGFMVSPTTGIISGQIADGVKISSANAMASTAANPYQIWVSSALNGGVTSVTAGTNVTVSSTPAGAYTINAAAAGGGQFMVSPSTGILSGTLPVGVKVATGSLSASGTPSASTFLRGDNTWATPSGSGDMVQSTHGVAIAQSTASLRTDFLAEVSSRTAGTWNNQAVKVGTSTVALSCSGAALTSSSATYANTSSTATYASNADMVDSIHASAFDQLAATQTVTAQKTFQGQVTFSSNAVVGGVYVDSCTVRVQKDFAISRTTETPAICVWKNTTGRTMSVDGFTAFVSTEVAGSASMTVRLEKRSANALESSATTISWNDYSVSAGSVEYSTNTWQNNTIAPGERVFAHIQSSSGFDATKANGGGTVIFK